MKTLIQTFMALFFAACLLPANAADKGFLGLAVDVDGEGFMLNPTLKSIKVNRVVPGYPADIAGIAAGDLIVEVEGRPVVGAKANEMQPYLQREVGQSVRLAVKKPNGEVKRVELTAVTKPK